MRPLHHLQCRRDLSFDFAQNPEALEGQVRMIGIGRRRKMADLNTANPEHPTLTAAGRR